MSYFSGSVDPDDYADGYSEENPRKSRLKVNLAIFVVVMAALSSTFAANISLNGGQRKEFGQGIFQIKACDQWVGIGLQSAAAPDNDYVGYIKLYGFDPRLCVGRVFKIKLFQTVGGSPLNLFLGPGQTTGTDTATYLSLMDTSTPFATSGYQASSGYTAYDNWAADAVTIVDKYGRNIGWSDPYTYINYYPSTSVYVITLTYPRALSSAVANVTIESACYLTTGSCR